MISYLMKQLFLTFLLALSYFTASAIDGISLAQPVSEASDAQEVKDLGPKLGQVIVADFLEMTPAKYREMTGERLGIVNSIKLKRAQKILKREMAAGGDGITKGLYILLAILGLAWVAMGVKSDWDGSDWIVNLILTVLCWLPGFIHALIKMKDYYPK